MVTNTPQLYRLYFMTPAGDVVREMIIYARTDDEAVEKSNVARAGKRATLWQGMRNVMGFPGD